MNTKTTLTDRRHAELLSAFGGGRRVTDQMFEIIYPDRRTVSRDWIVSNAKDELATEYMRQNPEADDAAIEENSRVASLVEAIEILSDAGKVTFTQDALDRARMQEENR